MHPAKAFRIDDAAALAFAAHNGFAHLFAATPAGPRVAHLPVVIGDGELRFHLSNGNGLTAPLAGLTALASFGGPGAYISPNWYADRRNAVPTWNYVAVEIEGPVRRMAPDELVALLDETAAHHEPRVGENWTRAKMDPARFTAMCGAITGFVLTIGAIRATAKLGQNKPEADARGAIAGLEAAGDAATARLMRQARGW